MSGIRVEFPGVEMSGAVEAAALALRQSHRNTLETLGTMILQFSQLDYVTKANGGTGTDGIKWEPVLVSTILARLRHKAGHLKAVAVKDAKLHALIPVGKTQKQVLVVAKSVKSNQKLFNQLAAAGVKFHDKKTGKVIIGDRARTATGTVLSVSKTAANKRVRQAPGTYEIGVNTGLQRTSGSPGYRGPDQVRQSDEVNSITVGYGRSYSAAFDKHRKLFPDVMPAAWIEDLQEKATEAGGKVVADTLASHRMS